MQTARQLLDQDPKKTSTTALKTFFNISQEWGLSAQQEKILLGQPAHTTFYNWRKGKGPVISMDTLERISYILGIYKALRLLFPTKEQAASWPKRHNQYFNGETALDVMLRGSVMSLAEVRRYLDAARG